MKKSFRISFIALLALAAGFVALEVAFENSLSQSLLVQFASPQRLIKSGSLAYCELGQQKVSRLDENGRKKIKQFLIEEFTGGPSRVKRSEPIPYLAVGDVNVLVENCLLRIVDGFVLEAPELLPLLARPDNIVAYGSYEILEVFKKYIIQNPDNMRFFTPYLQNYRSKEAYMASELLKVVGKPGLEIATAEFVKALQLEQNQRDFRQIAFFWSAVEENLRRNSFGLPCSKEIESLVVHAMVPEHMGPEMAYSLTTICAKAGLSKEVLNLAATYTPIKEIGYQAQAAYYQKVKEEKQKMLGELEKRSWEWKSAQDFTKADRELFLKYIAWISKEFEYAEQAFRDILERNKSTGEIDRPEYQIPSEIKFILESRYFPQDVKNQYLEVLRTKAKISFHDSVDLFVMTRLVTDSMTSNNSDVSQQAFFNERGLVTSDMYFSVFKMLFENREFDKLPSDVKHQEGVYNPVEIQLTNFLDFMKSPASQKVVQLYFRGRDIKSMDPTTRAFHSLADGKVEYANHLTANFRCDQNTYVSVTALLPQNINQKLLLRLLDCPFQFLNERSRWQKLVDENTLAQFIEKETDEKKKNLFLDLYEKKQKVVF